MSELFTMPEIQLPDFADRFYSVADYGAIGNGLRLNTASFARAIDTCAQAGGGTVRIPAGIWLTGAIRLRSNVNLHVEAGALVLFSPDFNDYPLIQSSYEGRDVVRCMSPLYGEKLENIAITGQGVFDGSGDSWRPVKKMKLTAVQWKRLVTSGGVVEENSDIWWPTRSAMEG
ncbi:MAG: glycoside hydrolase family 28, partial [Bacilli bacterium]|nr:glycoside hydrolase family 28 [Bacilli bacterium]